jgi:hypothetical protein
MRTVIRSWGDLGECRKEGGQIRTTAARAVIVNGRVGGVVLAFEISR